MRSSPVFLNLFVALLLENFEYIWEGEYAIEEVDVASYQKNWDELVVLAVDETVIMLHLPLSLVGVSVAMERERQQNDSLANGYISCVSFLLRIINCGCACCCAARRPGQ